jgi:flagellar hook assembly protein FlgD
MYISQNKSVYWDGRNDAGQKVASGMYFYTLKADKFIATRRMVIMK